MKFGTGRRRVKRPPRVLMLSLPMVAHENGIYQWFAADPRRTRYQAKVLNGLFAFKSDERRFAHILLAHKPNYWVFRCNQQAFCGDFIVVDMSCPQVSQRRVYVLELKENTELKHAAGCAGFQLHRVASALATIAGETEAIPAEPDCDILVGSCDLVLAHLGIEETQLETECERAAALASVG